MAASCINTVTEYVIVVWLWCISVFLLEFIETRSAKMEFLCSETGHGGFIIACILSIFRLESENAVIRDRQINVWRLGGRRFIAES